VEGDAAIPLWLALHQHLQTKRLGCRGRHCSSERCITTLMAASLRSLMISVILMPKQTRGGQTVLDKRILRTIILPRMLQCQLDLEDTKGLSFHDKVYNAHVEVKMMLVSIAAKLSQKHNKSTFDTKYLFKMTKHIKM